MRETSYKTVIAEMTVRALWETQNIMDCIPDEIWDKEYAGSPLWQHVYHMLHKLDQWFINPRDKDFVEPPIHTPALDDLETYPTGRLGRRHGRKDPQHPPQGAAGGQHQQGQLPFHGSASFQSRSMSAVVSGRLRPSARIRATKAAALQAGSSRRRASARSGGAET